MKRILLAVVATATATLLFTGPEAQAVVLVNPGFELGNDGLGTDGPGAFGWAGFNDRFSVSDFAETGTKSLKVFGPFFNGGGAGVVQGGFPALPGQQWAASASIFSPQADFVGVNNFAITKLEFLNAANAVIGVAESSHFNASAPANTWIKKSTVGIAPAGTTSAQIVLVHVQLDPVDGGAVYYDNASLELIPEPATALLGGLGLVGVALTCRRRKR